MLQSAEGTSHTAGGLHALYLCSPLEPEVGLGCDLPTMRALLSTLWLALACSSVHTTLSKSDDKKAASKTLLEKVGVVWGLTDPSCLLPALWGHVPRPLMRPRSWEPGALASSGGLPVLAWGSGWMASEGAASGAGT